MRSAVLAASFLSPSVSYAWSLQTRQTAPSALLSRFVNTTKQWKPLGGEPGGVLEIVPILVNLNLAEQSDLSIRSAAQTITSSVSLLLSDHIQISFPSSPGSINDPRTWSYECPAPGCSSPAACHSLFDCIYPSVYLESFQSVTGLEACLHDNVYNQPTADLSSLLCLIQLAPLLQQTACSNADLEFTKENWINAITDQNLNIFAQGGVDTEGVWWRGNSTELPNDLGRELLGLSSFQCSLERPCTATLSCDNVGTHTTQAQGIRVNSARR